MAARWVWCHGTSIEECARVIKKLAMQRMWPMLGYRDREHLVSQVLGDTDDKLFWQHHVGKPSVVSLALVLLHYT